MVRAARGLASLSIVCMVAGCGQESGAPVGPSDPDTVVHSIVVDPAARTVGVLDTEFWVGAGARASGGTLLYSSTFRPERFHWESTAPEIAAVRTRMHEPTGNRIPVVVGLAEGVATIRSSSQGVTGSMTVTVRENARLAWSLPLGTGSIDAGITVAHDGTIYVGTNEYGSNRSVWYAISPDGAKLWDLSLTRTWYATPAIGIDGTLYLGAQSLTASGSSLLAVRPDGSVRWELSGLTDIRSTPALDDDGVIYVAGRDHVYAVEPEGSVRWAYHRPGSSFSTSSPAIGRNGAIHVGSTDGYLHAINPDGSPGWAFKVDGLIQSSPAVGADGVIYFASIGASRGTLHAVGPDGMERWNLPLSTRLVSSSPSVAPDGTIYVVSSGVTAVDPAGVIRWNHGCGTNGATPILGANDRIYFTGCLQGPGGDAIQAFDSQGRLVWDYRTDGMTTGSSAIGSNGLILAATYSDEHEVTLHAITETSSANGGFDGAPWPTARGNRANNGRAGSP